MGEKNAGAVCGAYLDYAAATPVDQRVLDEMLPYFTEVFHNPSAPYALARRARAAVEDARARVAAAIGARPANVTFTAGATEANNLAFAATAGHVVTDVAEHDSVLACVAGRPHTLVGVGPDGRVDAGEVAAAITPETTLVSVELANGEVGCLQPVRAIGRAVAEERERRLRAGESNPIWFHVDASQGFGQVSVNVSNLGCDLLTLSAAKAYGPKQVGALWAADGVALRPLVHGGGQEGGVRSGTENVPGVVGMAAALELAEAGRAAEARRLAGLRDSLQAQLAEALPGMVVSGPRASKLRLPGLLHVSFPGLEARRLVILLERRGVSVGTGSACAASKMKSSHVLAAMGLTPEAAAGSLRMTLGRPTTQAEVDYAAAAIIEAVRAEAARVGLDPAAPAPVAHASAAPATVSPAAPSASATTPAPAGPAAPVSPKEGAKHE